MTSLPTCSSRGPRTLGCSCRARSCSAPCTAGAGSLEDDDGGLHHRGPGNGHPGGPAGPGGDALAYGGRVGRRARRPVPRPGVGRRGVRAVFPARLGGPHRRRSRSGWRGGRGASSTTTITTITTTARRRPDHGRHVDAGVFEDGVPPHWRHTQRGRPAAGRRGAHRRHHAAGWRPADVRRSPVGDILESVEEIPEPHAFTARLHLDGPGGSREPRGRVRGARPRSWRHEPGRRGRRPCAGPCRRTSVAGSRAAR